MCLQIRLLDVLSQPNYYIDTKQSVVLQSMNKKWHESSQGLVRMCLQTKSLGVVSHPC